MNDQYLTPALHILFPAIIVIISLHRPPTPFSNRHLLFLPVSNSFPPFVPMSVPSSPFRHKHLSFPFLLRIPFVCHSLLHNTDLAPTSKAKRLYCTTSYEPSLCRSIRFHRSPFPPVYPSWESNGKVGTRKLISSFSNRLSNVSLLINRVSPTNLIWALAHPFYHHSMNQISFRNGLKITNISTP